MLGVFDIGYTTHRKSGENTEQRLGRRNQRRGEAAEPAASAPASAEAMAGIEGTYDARISANGQGKLTFTVVIKCNGDRLVTEVPNPSDINIVGKEGIEDDGVADCLSTFLSSRAIQTGEIV